MLLLEGRTARACGKRCKLTTEKTNVEPILRVVDLKKHFAVTRGIVFKKKIGEVKAIDGVTFDLYPGETLGLVGESGCGKTTIARTIIRLEEPTSGQVFFEGRDIFAMSKSELRHLRSEITIIFQDPYASLNPRMTVGDIIAEPWHIHGSVPRKNRKNRVQELLEVVGLNPNNVSRYPHQFSGGQRQRVGIARALAVDPKIIICDEPVSALDVSVQAQVVNLLVDIQKEFGVAYLFIAHDLAVVRHIVDRVAVMYLGKVAEQGNEFDVFDHAAHPYTQALLSAVPVPDPTIRSTADRIILKGDVPSPTDPPSGCRFRTRCWKAEDVCADVVPELVDRGQGHPVACHFPEVRSVV